MQPGLHRNFSGHAFEHARARIDQPIFPMPHAHDFAAGGQTRGDELRGALRRAHFDRHLECALVCRAVQRAVERAHCRRQGRRRGRKR